MVVLDEVNKDDSGSIHLDFTVIVVGAFFVDVGDHLEGEFEEVGAKWIIALEEKVGAATDEVS